MPRTLRYRFEISYDLEDRKSGTDGKWTTDYEGELDVVKVAACPMCHTTLVTPFVHYDDAVVYRDKTYNLLNEEGFIALRTALLEEMR